MTKVQEKAEYKNEAIAKLRKMPTPIKLSTVSSYTAIGGSIKVWRSSDGWRFDGSACYGPREVRRANRGGSVAAGPCWTGPISAQFASVLLRKIQQAGESVTTTPRMPCDAYTLRT